MTALIRKKPLTRALAVEFRRKATDVRALADRIRTAVNVPIGQPMRPRRDPPADHRPSWLGAYPGNVTVIRGKRL